MTRAGYCKICQQNVFLDDAWGCVHGHDWTQIEGWYDADNGQPITPYWIEQAAGGDAQAITGEPLTPEAEPEPTPEPEPQVDPVEAMRELLRDRLVAINVIVAEENGVLSVSRGDDYAAAIAVEASGEIVLWERLTSGVDPGVRALTRAIAHEGGWRTRVALRREAVTG